MIQLPYGPRQRFRRHHDDINIIGRTDARLAPLLAQFRLNRGDPTSFYIEPEEKASDPPQFPYGMKTPGCHRLRKCPGWFNLEIPIDSSRLIAGWNTVDIDIVGRDGTSHHTSAEFCWDPRPPQLPLDLTNLREFDSIQGLGQAVNGMFELDVDSNVIRAAKPVGPDILLLLGPPTRSQEATYRVQFGSPSGTWLGLSDFFVGHVEQSAELGIKPGYSTNGLATLGRDGGAHVWIAWGDNLIGSNKSWIVQTRPGLKKFPIQPGRKYRVRHQVRVTDALNSCRFRIWPEGEAEPSTWLCKINNAAIPAHLPRNHLASFGLFQYFGSPTEWSDIRLQSLEVE
tara:strand:+ start:54383 stop:55405 length:1023 start_codon:yes stop_codon:yes gene_type:complete